MKAILIASAIAMVLCQNKFISLFCMVAAIVSFIVWILNKIADKGY